MPRDLPVWRPDAPRVGNDVLAVRQGCGVTPATRAQMSDALDLVNAYIDARAAHDAYLDQRGLNGRHEWHTKSAHADELLELYRARYGATR